MGPKPALFLDLRVSDLRAYPSGFTRGRDASIFARAFSLCHSASVRFSGGEAL